MTVLLTGVDLAYPQRVASGGLIKRVSDSKVLADIRDFEFVAIKATQGTSIVDGQWANSYAMARKFGKKIIAYHYNDNRVGVVAQVDFFLKTAKEADAFAIDQEGTYAFSDAQTQTFVTNLKGKTAKPVGYYHSTSGFGGVTADFRWVADYTSTALQDGHPPIDWDMWQFSSEGGPDGAGLDLDYMRNDSPLAAALGLVQVSKALTDAIHEADLTTIQDQLFQIAERDAKIIDEQKANAALQATIDSLNAQLAQAPEKERTRIADAEAARILAI